MNTINAVAEKLERCITYLYGAIEHAQSTKNLAALVSAEEAQGILADAQDKVKQGQP